MYVKGRKRNMIRLTDVTEDNWLDIVRLSVDEEHVLF